MFLTLRFDFQHLPNSQVTVSFLTKMFQLKPDDDSLNWVRKRAHIKMRPTFDEFTLSLSIIKTDTT
jgi:hypothetical protein